MSEAKEELEAEARDIADKISIWRSLKESSGWLLLENTILEQLKPHRAGLMAPLSTMDEVLREQFEKGEVARAAMILGLPDTQLDVLQAQAEQLEKELKDVQEDALADGRSEREREQRTERGPVDERHDPFGGDA